MPKWEKAVKVLKLREKIEVLREQAKRKYKKIEASSTSNPPIYIAKDQPGHSINAWKVGDRVEYTANSIRATDNWKRFDVGVISKIHQQHDDFDGRVEVTWDKTKDKRKSTTHTCTKVIESIERSLGSGYSAGWKGELVGFDGEKKKHIVQWTSPKTKQTLISEGKFKYIEGCWP